MYINLNYIYLSKKQSQNENTKQNKCKVLGLFSGLLR